jgi:hypothetical protein
VTVYNQSGLHSDSAVIVVVDRVDATVVHFKSQYQSKPFTENCFSRCHRTCSSCLTSVVPSSVTLVRSESASWHAQQGDGKQEAKYQSFWRRSGIMVHALQQLRFPRLDTSRLSFSSARIMQYGHFQAKPVLSMQAPRKRKCPSIIRPHATLLYGIQ